MRQGRRIEEDGREQQGGDGTEEGERGGAPTFERLARLAQGPTGIADPCQPTRWSRGARKKGRHHPDQPREEQETGRDRQRDSQQDRSDRRYVKMGNKRRLREPRQGKTPSR